MMAAVKANRPRLIPPSQRALRGRRDEQRGHGHQHGVDGERVEDHAVDGDAEHPGGVRALGGGLHLAAGVGAAQEQLQGEDHDDAHDQDADVVGRDGDPAGPPHLGAEHRRELLRRGAELESEVLADDQGQTDGGDDERDVVAARRQQAVDERDLEHVAEQQDGDRDRDDEGGDDADLRERPGEFGAADDGNPVGQPQGRALLPEDEHDDRGQDDELAVGEVDRSGGLPQQGEPHRGEGEDRPGRQPREADLEERRHRA